MPNETTPVEPKSGRRPWWIPPFLGRVPDLEPETMRTLALVSLGMMFEAYDLSLLTAALKHISQDFGIPAAELGVPLGWIRFGGVMAFFLLPFADRMGRRRVFLGTIAVMSIGTLATAFSQTLEQFVVFQTLTRACLLTASATAFVMITEEFPAEHRGWGIGMAGALAAFGYGLGAMLFAAVDVLPYGWRALYLVGALPLIFLPYFRREVRETRRFQRHRLSADVDDSWRTWMKTPASLVRRSPLRAAVVAAAGFVSSFATLPVFQFTSVHVQQAHGWVPWQYSLMFVVAGTMGIVGHMVAGRLGDRIGRRAVGCAAFVLYPIAAALFYNGPAWTLPVAWVGIVFFSSAGDVIVRAFTGELFPTAQRAASAGWLVLFQSVGWMLGLWTMHGLVQASDDLPRVITLLSMGTVVAGLALLALPETRSRELEVLNPEAEASA